ncbi:thiol:disulfide interchange protein DsbA/DsbL [Halomonas piscis]|uniref:Thiol:disulfide interchange protein n=1 Tax=Halomonas piscis TaxID=3031727 RepID=A0ABY9YZW8_9GAMM|nr:thiol:disulfide interchange protein DsbA/DsbL [Halomonas piscis]WNK20424.1 thiol:disulfide interchange protein DsbA/DsbL [Halomonas piscis]
MLKTAIVALAGLGLSAAVSAQTLTAGEDYETLETPVETRVDDGQIEVTEVFWFGCPHCYRLQPAVTEWYDTLPDDVGVVHQPATMGGAWNVHARAFYAAQELGIEEDLHKDFFDAIHKDGRELTDTDELAAFFADYGVSKDEAREALGSFGVKSQVNKAHARLRNMRLKGVPALMVDGRYLVTPQSAGSLDNMPKIADALVERVREDRTE